ncbi:hypothetical protein M9458_017295, partial [Cirrhinus mrigala]
RPVLLVCSSNDTAHVAAVCGLASGLQGELFMDVRLAHPLWLSWDPVGPPDAHQAFLRWRKRWVAGSETGLYSALEKKEQMCCDEEWMEKPLPCSPPPSPVCGREYAAITTAGVLD